MKIIVDKILGVQPTWDRNYSGLELNLEVCSHQLEELFYRIWNDEGDDWIAHKLLCEGFKMVKI